MLGATERLGMDRFNPRPLLLTGESRDAMHRPAEVECFNPRPLLLTGESHRAAVLLIHDFQFQSTPVIANGRITLEANQLR